MAIASEFGNYDALGLAQLIRDRDVSATEVMEAAIERIEKVNPALNFISVRCYELGRSLANGDVQSGPFMGVPYLLKDSFMDYEGTVSTQCCKMFKEYVSTFDMGSVTSAKGAASCWWPRLLRPNAVGTHRPSLRSSVTRAIRGIRTTRRAAPAAARRARWPRACYRSRARPTAPGRFAFLRAIARSWASRSRAGAPPFLPAYPDVLYGGGVVGCVSLSVRDTAAYIDAIADYTPANQYRLPKPERPYVKEAARDPERLRIGYATRSPSELPLDDDCVAAVEAAAKLCESLGHDMGYTPSTFSVFMKLFIMALS